MWMSVYVSWCIWDLIKVRIGVFRKFGLRRWVCWCGRSAGSGRYGFRRDSRSALESFAPGARISSLNSSWSRCVTIVLYSLMLRRSVGEWEKKRCWRERSGSGCRVRMRRWDDINPFYTTTTALQQQISTTTTTTMKISIQSEWLTALPHAVLYLHGYRHQFLFHCIPMYWYSYRYMRCNVMFYYCY